MPHERDLLDVRSSAVHGSGVFALRPVAKGEVVGSYAGRRYLADDVIEVEANSEITYLFGLSDGTTIDGAQGGNKTRHLNHSCAPNCEAVERWDADDRLGLQIVAIEPIAQGEELLLDYALTVDPADESAYLCLCGAARCRGTMAATS